MRCVKTVAFSYLICIVIYLIQLLDYITDTEKKLKLEMYYEYIKKIQWEDLHEKIRENKNFFEFVNEKYMLQSGCLIGYMGVYLGASFRSRTHGL